MEMSGIERDQLHFSRCAGKAFSRLLLLCVTRSSDQQSRHRKYKIVFHTIIIKLLISFYIRLFAATKII